MKKRDRATLKAYVRTLADQMGLRDWRFMFEYDIADEDVSAHVSTLYGRRTAKLGFARNFRNEEPEFQRMVVVHELIHIPSHGIFWYIIKTLPDILGSAAYAAWEKAYRQLDEVATDTLAEAFASHFPLIEWPK